MIQKDNKYMNPSKKGQKWDRMKEEKMMFPNSKEIRYATSIGTSIVNTMCWLNSLTCGEGRQGE